jgi:hypothetical protein
VSTPLFGVDFRAGFFEEHIMAKKRISGKLSGQSRVNVLLAVAEMCREIGDRSQLVSNKEYDALRYLFDCIEPALGLMSNDRAYPTTKHREPLLWIQWCAQWQCLSWIANHPGVRPPECRGNEYFLRFLSTRGYITIDENGIPKPTDLGRLSVSADSSGAVQGRASGKR